MHPFRVLLVLISMMFLAGSVQAEGKWKEYKSRHFIIKYQNAPMHFIEQVEKAAENEYSEISDGIGVRRMKTWSLDNRAEIYIYDDDEHYQESGQQAGWSHGAASPEEKVIRSYPAAHGFFDSTLPHELAHIMFRELIGYDVQVPLWLEEGVAMYYEKGRRFGAHQVVKQALEDGTFIPLDELSQVVLSRSSSQEDVLFFYQEAASAVNFLIDELGGGHKFEMFCKKLGKDRSFNQAFGSIYTRQKDLQGLNRAWIKFLQTQ